LLAYLPRLSRISALFFLLTSVLFAWSMDTTIPETLRATRGETFVNVYANSLRIALVLIVSCVLLKVGSKREILSTIAWFVAGPASVGIQILILGWLLR
jgi:hypothetical protein